MSRISLAFSVEDLSTFAKSLRRQFLARDGVPSHVELLNMLARSAGHRNYQALRRDAAKTLPVREAAPQPTAEPAPDAALVERVSRHFDETGRLLRWPSRRSQQILCLWPLWAAFPAGRDLGDREVREFLASRNAFGDPALLRRELCDGGLVERTIDGRIYRRVERRPPPDALALIRRLKPAMPLDGERP